MKRNQIKNRIAILEAIFTNPNEDDDRRKRALWLYIEIEKKYPRWDYNECQRKEKEMRNNLCIHKRKKHKCAFNDNICLAYIGEDIKREKIIRL